MYSAACLQSCCTTTCCTQGIARLQSEALLLRSVSVLRALSKDPAVLPALDQAGAIQGTMALLLGVPLTRSLPVQLEVLHTVFNLCKLKSDRCVLRGIELHVIHACMHVCVPKLLPFAVPLSSTLVH